MTVTERTRAFSALRTIGAQRTAIIGVALIEALSLAPVGVPVTIGLVALMSRMMETSLPSALPLSQIVGATGGIEV